MCVHGLRDVLFASIPHQGQARGRAYNSETTVARASIYDWLLRWQILLALDDDRNQFWFHFGIQIFDVWAWFVSFPSLLMAHLLHTSALKNIDLCCGVAPYDMCANKITYAPSSAKLALINVWNLSWLYILGEECFFSIFILLFMEKLSQIILASNYPQRIRPRLTTSRSSAFLQINGFKVKSFLCIIQFSMISEPNSF